MSDFESEAGVNAIAELTREGMASEVVVTGDGREFLLRSKSVIIDDVTDEHGLHTGKPKYTKQTVSLQTTVSLADYLNRYKLTQTTIFADIGKDRFESIVDYHGPSAADYLAHRANMQLSRSEEWRLWTDLHKRGLVGQLDFARFIEENAADIKAPSAGELLDAVRDLQAHRKVNFTKAVRTSSENENFEFQVDNEAKTKGGLELPTKFLLWIPVYFNEPPVEVSAFLRWKIDAEEGGLQLGLSLNRMEFVRQQEFQRIAQDISDKVERPLVYGTLA